MSGIKLRYLAFSGPNVDLAELKFDDGLNILYGASNTGKTFALKAILFMLGASNSLPPIDEIPAYDAVWLGITLGDEGDFTLYRSTQGGHFRLYPGLVKRVGESQGEVLREAHDRRRTDTISHRLLNAIGLAGKWVVSDASSGKTESLSIRLLAKYAIVAEDDIMSERSPVFLSGTPSAKVFERNLFKLLLTGQDDASVVAVPKESERKAAKAAKIELVDELLTQLDAELGNEPPNEQETKDRLERLDASVDDLLSRLQTAQNEIDGFVTQRRRALDRALELRERADELDITLERFAMLGAVYISDLERLQSIEEGGYALAAIAKRECPVCGAPPSAQTHTHAAEEISVAHAAAAAEARKIEREQRELALVVASLEAEGNGLRKTLQQLEDDVESLDGRIEERRPQEASLRESYETQNAARSDLLKILDLFDRRAKLVARRTEIGAIPTRRVGTVQTVGPSSTTQFDFGETVKAVLTAWKFPDAEKAQFDGSINDITVGGKPRSANGKGVRAVLHAAFNVALLVHCIEKKLPHPGFLVLDTPLLTYREPLTSKHGELSQDEQALKASSLAENFYKHLASLKDHVQILVIENSDPPAATLPLARIEVFTRQPDEGRFGLLARRA